MQSTNNWKDELVKFFDTHTPRLYFHTRNEIQTLIQSLLDTRTQETLDVVERVKREFLETKFGSGIEYDAAYLSACKDIDIEIKKLIDKTHI